LGWSPGQGIAIARENEENSLMLLGNCNPERPWVQHGARLPDIVYAPAFATSDQMSTALSGILTFQGFTAGAGPSRLKWAQVRVQVLQHHGLYVRILRNAS
jgi:hypothetical protein